MGIQTRFSRAMLALEKNLPILLNLINGLLLWLIVIAIGIALIPGNTALLTAPYNFIRILCVVFVALKAYEVITVTRLANPPIHPLAELLTTLLLMGFISLCQLFLRFS